MTDGEVDAVAASLISSYGLASIPRDDLFSLDAVMPLIGHLETRGVTIPASLYDASLPAGERHQILLDLFREAA